MRTYVLLAVLAISPVFVGAARAADGDLDPGWTTDAEFPGYGFYFGGFGVDKSDSVEAVLPAANGRTWLVGNVNSAPDTYRIGVYRLLPDGLADYAFGDAGLRTYVMPCDAGRVTDAALDREQRPWILIGGCGDFLAYRLAANGDLDTSLLGSGVLTIPFDLGGDLVDHATRIAALDDGSVLIAGRAGADDPSRVLAVAHFDGDGQPVAGFGDAGRATLALSITVTVMNGLHVMDDGRIVVTGYRVGNGNTHDEFVARLQPNGAADASFGADGPGYSVYVPLGPPDWIPGTSGGSVLLEDGSIVRTGTRAGDYYVARWKPDGQPDLAVGPSGFRTFALDFGGGNHDAARLILRQRDGRFLLVGNSDGIDGLTGLGIARIDANFDLDAGFGDGGKRRYLAPIASDGVHGMAARAIAIVPGRILVGADVATGPGQAQMQSVIALESDLLFADNFD
jgi:uncharacterized delta-60 repeat protein